MLRTISRSSIIDHNRIIYAWKSPLAKAQIIRTTSHDSKVGHLGYETIPLKYHVEHADKSKATSSRGNLVLVHGLFGSKQNFRSIAKRLAKDLHMDCYTVDLRNHGDSAHSEKMTYPVMAADLYRLLEHISANSRFPISLLGHSLGGKVVMSLALHPALYLSSSSRPHIQNLIVEDIAPTKGRLSKEFEGYARAMQEMALDNSIRTRKDADAKLSKIEPDITVRQFLLTNLINTSPNSPPTFRVPPGIIIESLAELGDFPFAPDRLISEEEVVEMAGSLNDSTRTDIQNIFGGRGVPFKGRTLIIRGKKSAYIKDTALPVFDTFFPRNELSELDTGHWIHAEDINGFIRVVVDFIQRGER